MIKLKPITKDNVDDVLSLSVRDDQKNYVSSVSDSLAQAYVYSENAYPFAVYYDDILSIHFISLDQNINCAIKCLKTDTFAEVEEKLYQKYGEYRETNNNFTANGRIILRFKSISDNHIKDGDKVQLINIEWIYYIFN